MSNPTRGYSLDYIFEIDPFRVNTTGITPKGEATWLQ